MATPDAVPGTTRPAGEGGGALPLRAVAALLVAVVAVAFSRSPYLLTRGRLFAEEGTVFFHHMLGAEDPGGLLFVYERNGYLVLFTNAGTWLAARAPLGQAPLVTAWLSLGVLVVLVLIVLRWPSDLLTTRGARLAAATLLVIGTAALPEVWLTSLNTTTAFGILALVLLFVRVDELSRGQATVGLVVLGVAGLSGIYAAALAPLFLVTAFAARSRRRWVAAAIVTTAAAIQVALVARAHRSGAMAESRLTELTVDEIARSVGGLHVVGFAVGAPAVDRLATAVDDRSMLAAAAVGLVLLAVVVAVAAIVWRAPDRRVPLLLLAAFVIIEVAVLVGSLGRGAPGRYAVVPMTIVTFLVIYGATAVADRRVTRAATALLVVALVAGLAGFWTAEPTLLRCLGCPEWEEQVAAWEAGGPSEVRIWPYGPDARWTVQLADEPPP